MKRGDTLILRARGLGGVEVVSECVVVWVGPPNRSVKVQFSDGNEYWAKPQNLSTPEQDAAKRLGAR